MPSSTYQTAPFPQPGPHPSAPPALNIGDPAPIFQARSTLGDINLSDYRGQWVILFSHPADFTPVCTSEFMALAKAHDRFRSANCQLFGVSVDSLYAHLGWVRAIQDHFGVRIDFPIIEDPSLVIGRAYGMISDHAPDAASMRSTFFIDPEGIVRAMHCYPATVGRSVEEMLRLLYALQRVATEAVFTPEGWAPGQDILLPPAQDDATALTSSGRGCWFYRSSPDGQAR